MQISQLQVVNDAIQDRLLLRIATPANEEIRVFITRRFLRELWPYLAAMLHGHLAHAPTLTASTEPEGSNAPSFDQPFRESNPLYPLGSQPLLASQATLEAIEPGLARLTLREDRERACHLRLNADLLQALCAMLRAASERAQWEIALDYPVNHGIATTSAMPRRSLLH